MTKRQERFYRQFRNLQAHGWDVSSEYRSNAGSETTPHFVAKCLVCKAVEDKGHRWRMEASHDDRGEIDVVVIPEMGAPYAVELESSPTNDVLEDKKNRYVNGTPMRDIYMLNLNEMPLNMLDALGWIEEQLP